MSRRATRGGDLPLIEWGDALRQRRLDHRRRTRRWATFLAPLVGALALSIALPPAPRLLWNASASAPIGLYIVRPGKVLHRGDTVIARVPEGVRTLAASRRYMPVNVPLVKHVGGVAGDTICASGTGVAIDGKPVAVRRLLDGARRPMPWWTGCRRVLADQIFLLSPDAPASFDGRYFGVSPTSDIVGTARALWLR